MCGRGYDRVLLGCLVRAAWHAGEIYDVSEAVLSRANAELRDAYDTLVEAGVMTDADMSTSLSRITTTTDLAEAVKDVDYVQESGPERYRIKREIYRELDRLARPEAILASSTSAMLMTEIQKATTHPERCVVAHPYNPPHIVPLVEIVPGEATSAETVAVARDFMASMGGCRSWRAKNAEAISSTTCKQ